MLVRKLQGSRFLEAHATVMTWVARFVGALFCLSSVLALISAVLSSQTSPWMYLLVLLFAGIGVGLILATPIAGKQLAYFQRDSLGTSKVSVLRQNSGPQIGMGDSPSAPSVDAPHSSPNPSLERP